MFSFTICLLFFPLHISAKVLRFLSCAGTFLFYGMLHNRTPWTQRFSNRGLLDKVALIRYLRTLIFVTSNLCSATQDKSRATSLRCRFLASLSPGSTNRMYVFVLGWLLTGNLPLHFWRPSEPELTISSCCLVGLGLLFVLFLHKYRQWRAHQRVRQWRDSLSLAYLIIQQQVCTYMFIS